MNVHIRIEATVRIDGRENKHTVELRVERLEGPPGHQVEKLRAVIAAAIEALRASMYGCEKT